ncbi:hypothetical protein LOD99_6027 [Oopsacas minuta]|uniref:Uncharacterized protein n=1 Tax=Oopsacas minuta TaxID=111878 RepID=A0AAV7JPM0_9METZ|nr:hypothetical protein LOD99_6027 [Oopsacas minuta]
MSKIRKWSGEYVKFGFSALLNNPGVTEGHCTTCSIMSGVLRCLTDRVSSLQPNGNQFESLTSLILYLKPHSPEGPILKALLTTLQDSSGVQSLLLHWTSKEPDTLARALTSMIHIVANEDTDLELIVSAVKHISNVQSKTEEFQAVLRDADLIKCLLDLFESNDSLKDQFENLFTSLQQTKSSRRKSPQKGDTGIKRGNGNTRYPKKETKS